MPLTNLPKNCFHYWVLGGILLAGPVYSPFYTPSLPHASSFTSQAIVTIVWIFAQISNYKTHMTLRNLRPQGSKVRKVPFGYGFNWVSCPNYTFEVLGWICVTLLTGSLFGKQFHLLNTLALFFTLTGAVQMYFWAVKKHQRYKSEFGASYPPRRKILIPWIL